ncbi:hypothetical protein DPMN_043882 [Dreissena polymorpha]|uniref:Concentrative nucleoside transporter C-terminal domain-containing protein n=1 Tax=Dreissena polymorpha TaxID=45954 RepID=A0A9D4D3K7_DREPO|nr:hypothetical protein DPMN_043882 [Dreissena polymorpha]
MGVAPADCLIVARMIGMKTFLNEFVAYQDLGKLRQNRLDLAQTVSDSTNLTWVWDGTDIVIYSKNVTLVGGGHIGESAQYKIVRHGTRYLCLSNIYQV